MTRSDRPEGRPGRSVGVALSGGTIEHGTIHAGDCIDLEPQQLALHGIAGTTTRPDDPDISVEAARATWERRGGRVRQLVEDEHRRAPSGLTDDHIALRHPDERPGRISTRRCDVVAAGPIEDSARRRPTRRGTLAIVWRWVP